MVCQTPAVGRNAGKAPHGAYQGPRKIERSGSIAVATPDATETMLNPIRAIAAHTTKETSDGFPRLRVETCVL